MKITNDLLNAMHIESVYIQTETQLYLCCPLKIKEDLWLISTGINSLEGKIKLKIKYNSNFIALDAVIDSYIEDSGLHSFIYVIKITSEKNGFSDEQKELLSTINYMETKYNEWNKRKEERYNIGTNDKMGELLRLKSLEQNIVFSNLQLPCIINNISYSGAKITTMESEFFNEKKVILCLSFVRPIEQIQILATIKHATVLTLSENKNVSVLSLNFDKSPLSFKERLTTFIKELSNDNN